MKEKSNVPLFKGERRRKKFTTGRLVYIGNYLQSGQQLLDGIFSTISNCLLHKRLSSRAISREDH